MPSTKPKDHEAGQAPKSDTQGREPGESRKGAVRLEKAISAVIQMKDGYSVPCVIQDLSSGGAKLETIGKIRELSMFVLFVPAYDLALNCQTIWHRNGRLGIQFLSGRPDVSAILEAHGSAVLKAENKAIAA